ncbi:MAG TPA: ribbon-helix-helix protein, CopG family [Pseudonocardiaceae bacterium]|jgi:metal-responsive CopG/Arc/MetJ family transcriptional regulator
MRTTVTLDDDLAIRLERLSHEQGRSFKSVINEALRAGLEALQRIPEQREPGEQISYTTPVDLGHMLMSVEEATEQLDDEYYRQKLQ